MERQAFNRQPARAVIIDLHSPMDSGTCNNIKEAMSSVLTILTSLSGPHRVPLFSLSIIKSYTECIYQLQPIRGNFSRIQIALDELASLARDLITQQGRIRASFLDGIQESIAQFNRHVHSMKQGTVSSTNSPSQIEVTILTAQAPSSIKQSIERIANHLDLQYLKKIQAICINHPQKLVEQVTVDDSDDALSSLSQSLSQLQPSPSELGISFLDIVTCDNDLCSLKMTLKTWLQDTSTDNEHLHITLPSPHLSSSLQSLILKCDLHNRMLHPSLFPSLAKHFSLNTGSNNISGPISDPTSSQALLPIYNLESVEFVDCDGICESIVYGMPLIVKPTTCWKLDWEELERNQQYFQALCLTMKSKSVAVNELLLPVDQGSNDEQLDQSNPEIMDALRGSLEKLHSSDCYNPLLMNSNLCETILHLSSKRVYTPLKSVSGSNRRGAMTNGQGRGRGKTQSTSRENGPPAKRRPSQKSMDSTSRTNVHNNVRQKRLQIMTGGSIYDNDHVSN